MDGKIKKKWTVLIAAVMALMLSGCAPQAEDVPQLLEPVSVRQLRTQVCVGEIYRVTKYDAEVTAHIQPIYFLRDGKAGAVYAYAGKQVASGEVLIELAQDALRERIEAEEEELEYLRKDGEYSDALLELDIELLRTELRQLQAQRADEVTIALKRNEIARKEAELRQNRSLREGELTALRKKLEADRVLLDEGILEAPFEGRIVYAQEIAQGDRVSAYTAVFHLMDEKQLRIECASVPQGVLSKADYLYAQVGAELYPLNALPVDEAERVSILLSGGEPRSRFEAVQAEEGSMQAGQYAAVYVVSDYEKEALLVPSTAIYETDGGYYVYVDEDGTRVRRTVRLGVVTDARVQILEGLAEGEWVYVQE